MSAASRRSRKNEAPAGATPRNPERAPRAAASKKKAVTKKAPTKKAPAKKAVAKKAPAKKAVAKKAPTKKVVAKKAPTKKAVARKAPAKKAVAKKAPTKKVVAKKAPAKKAATKKAATKKAPAKKAVAKKAPTKKAVAKKVPAKKPSSKKTPTKKLTAKKAPTAKKAAVPVAEVAPPKPDFLMRRPKPATDGEAPKPKPMNVAAKKRADAEAAFKMSAAGEEVKGLPATSPAQRAPNDFGPIRLNERDRLTIELRNAEGAEQTCLAALRLIDSKHPLPPDPTVLIGLVPLDDRRVRIAALEELLELRHRGRLRDSVELREALGSVPPADREAVELRGMILDHLGPVRAL
jgi:hypothetical protein